MQQTITPRSRTAGRAPDVERFNAASRARNARPRPSLIACAIALCAAPWMADPAAAQGRQQTVALQGQAAPGAGGAVFEFLHAPILNASGQVAFISALSGAGITQGVFRSDGGSVAAMVLQGQAAPGAGAGTFLNFDQLRLNGPGALSFYAAVAGGREELVPRDGHVELGRGRWAGCGTGIGGFPRRRVGDIWPRPAFHPRADREVE